MHHANIRIEEADLPLSPTVKQFTVGSLVALLSFGVLGSVAALWENPFFIRMTPAGGFEIAMLALQSVFLGVFVAVKTAGCSIKTASAGSIAHFLGIACPVCNKILLLLFGADALMLYFEPLRIYVAGFGMIVTGWAALYAWRNRSRSLPTVAVKNTAL